MQTLKELSTENDVVILFLKILKNNLILLITLAIVGLLLAIAFYFTKKPSYESSMIVQSEILTEAYSNTLTETLERLIQEGSYLLLSEKLDLSIKQAEQLIGIQVESITEDRGEDITKNRIFKIYVSTFDNSVLRDLEKGIINYLETNKFVSKRTELKRKRLRSLIKKIDDEISEIDSLKKIISLGSLINQNGSGDIFMLDPSGIYNVGISIYKDGLIYQESLELINSIELIEGFVAFKKPISPKLSVTIIFGLLGGLFIAIVIVCLKETHKYVLRLEKRFSLKKHSQR